MTTIIEQKATQLVEALIGPLKESGNQERLELVCAALDDMGLDADIYQGMYDGYIDVSKNGSDYNLLIGASDTSDGSEPVWTATITDEEGESVTVKECPELPWDTEAKKVAKTYADIYIAFHPTE